MNYTNDQIAQYAGEINEKRRQDRRELLADFLKTLDILMKCLLGNTTLPSER
jgi:hypothetical protein